MTGRERMAVFGVLLWLAGCAATPETGGSAVPRDPDRASVLARRGDLDWQAGREDAAIDAWQQAVALNPQDAVAVNNLALALAERHRYAEAARLLDDGIPPFAQGAGPPLQPGGPLRAVPAATGLRPGSLPGVP